MIDEIQRVPILLLAIKEFIDKDRTNGQFVLTGSANLKGFKDISDSLAGRIGIVELYPLSQKELSHSSENLIDILSGDIDHLMLKKYDNDGLSEKIINGGYPEITKITSEKSKYLWFSSYFNNALKRFIKIPKNFCHWHRRAGTSAAIFISARV